MTMMVVVDVKIKEKFWFVAFFYNMILFNL